MKKKETKIREKTKVARQVSKVMHRLCPSTSQPCKGVGPAVDKVQRVWFGGGEGGGGERPIVGILSSPLLGICWEDIFTKSGKKGRWEPSNAC